MVWMETGCDGFDFAVLVLLLFGGKWFFYQIIQFGLVSQEKWFGILIALSGCCLVVLIVLAISSV